MSETGESGAASEDGGSSEVVHAYRCPVCGHTDGASFMGAETLRIDCTHCDASLELTLRSEEKERVAVKVETGE